MVGVLVAGAKVAPWLGNLKTRLEPNHALVISLLLLLLGVVQFGEGLDGLL